MNPASAQHAALRSLLEDVQPLLTQAEELSVRLQQVREELHADVEGLRAVLRHATDTLPGLLELSRKLNSAAGRIEAATASAAASPQFRPGKPGRAHMPLPLVCILSALLGAATIAVAPALFNADLLEQARIGRALRSAWPSLDTTAHRKIHEAIARQPGSIVPN